MSRRTLSGLQLDDDDSFEEYEEFDNEEDDEEDDDIDLGYLDDNCDISLQVLTEEELSFLQDPPSTPISSGPTRAKSRIRGNDNEDRTRTTFICLNQEAFKNQLEKEQQKSGEINPLPNTGPTRARRQNQPRTTFICLNEETFKENLIKEQEKTKQETETKPIQTKEPPPRPSRPPRTKQRGNNQPINRGRPNQGKFGKAPPARRPSQSNEVQPNIKTKIKMPPVFHELIQTEKDYIANLEIIRDIFLQEIRKNQILSTYETVSLFSNIEDLIPINKNLLEDLIKLENGEASTKSVGEIFQAHARNFIPYSTYCSNQPNIHELVIEYKETNNEFAEFLKKTFRNPKCRKQDIESFLMMPLQRLCKYPLLLKELVSFETHTMNKNGPASSSDHGICIWGNGSPSINPIESNQHWIDISCGGLHYAAVTLGNSLYIWGKGKDGQLGLGDSVILREEPTLIPLYSSSNHPLKVLNVTCGPLQTAIITDNYELYLWGSLPNGRIFTPIKQTFDGVDKHVKQVTLSVACIFVIIQIDNDPSNTEVWSWGHSSRGLLGLGKDKTVVNNPTRILDLNGKNIIQISSGEYHACCLSEHGAVFIWGYNIDNILGLGSQSDSSKPQLVMNLLGKEIIELKCGFKHTFARSSNGKIYSWGYGHHGVLGIGQSIDVSSIDLIKGIDNKNINSIVTGGMHAFAISSNGKVYTWGEGRNYKTGLGNQEDIFSPILVKKLSSYVIKKIACGPNTSVAYYEKCSENQSSIVYLGEGLEEFRSVVIDINDQVRHVQNITSLINIANRIKNGERLKIVNQSRSFIKEGPININGKNRYVFLFNDLLILCKLPPKSDPNKLYKAFRRCNIEDCIIIDLPDSSDDNKFRIELQVKPNKVYLLKLRKKDRKISWIQCFKELNIPLEDINQSLLKDSSNNTSNHHKLKRINTHRKISTSLSQKDLKDLEKKAITKLLLKLEKELKEESQARIIAEQHNEAMISLVEEQKKIDSANLMDEHSMSEFKSRVESLSTMVDKLTDENILLTNQVKAKRGELIILRKANGKPIDDILDDDEEDSDDED